MQTDDAGMRKVRESALATTGRRTPPQRVVAVLALLVVLAAAFAAPAAGQAQWNETDVQGGKEFRLVNDAGATILLQCRTVGVGMGLQYSQAQGAARRVTVRGVPGEQRNIAVRAVGGGYLLQIASASGRDFIFRMLRSAASLSVTVEDRRDSFEVFGSDSIVSQCLQQQEGAPEE